MADEQGLPVDQGALISSGTPGQPGVFPDSPAADAGLVEGDIIVAVDGEPVDVDTELSSLLLPHGPGEAVTLTILRDGGSEQEVDVTLGELPADR